MSVQQISKMFNEIEALMGEYAPELAKLVAKVNEVVRSDPRGCLGVLFGVSMLWVMPKVTVLSAIATLVISTKAEGGKPEKLSEGLQFTLQKISALSVVGIALVISSFTLIRLVGYTVSVFAASSLSRLALNESHKT